MERLSERIENALVLDAVYGSIDSCSACDQDIVVTGKGCVFEHYKSVPPVSVICLYEERLLPVRITWIEDTEYADYLGYRGDNRNFAFQLRLYSFPGLDQARLLFYAVSSDGLLFPLTYSALLNGRTSLNRKNSQIRTFLSRLDDESRISRNIAPKDEMNNEWYFGVGYSGAQCVVNGFAQSFLSSVFNVLDMPCGHGRVTRYLRALFPNSMLDCCDINVDGVNFCASEFSAMPIIAHHDIRRTAFPHKYDLIWIGSMFTHFREKTVKIWIHRLLEILKPNGIVITTFHGRRHLEIFRPFYEEGLPGPGGSLGMETWERFYRNSSTPNWCYADFSGDYVKVSQLPYGNEYGLSWSSPLAVARVLSDIPDARIVSFIEGGWADNHDVLVFTKK